MKYLIFVIATCIALQTQATMQRPDLVMYDGVLYLAGLNAWQEDRKADLKELFPKRYMKGRVKADWFSGDLILSVRRWKGKSVTLMFAKGELYTRINHEEMKEKETKPSSSEANDSITIPL